MDMTAKIPVDVSTPGESKVVVTRRFNAPAALVWRAYTEPALIKRWLAGYPGWKMPVCEMDVRVGGTYRYRWRNEEDGAEFGFTGTFKAVDPGKRIEHTERPEDSPEMGASYNIVEFIPLGDQTELRMTMDYGSAEIREQVLATGMTDGMGFSYDQLDSVLAEITSENAFTL